MALFKPENITKEHVLAAVAKIEKNAPKLNTSTKYDVIINGKRYPPKEIMRYAHEKMNGMHIWDLGGGEATNKYLRAMGFQIASKNNDPIIDLINAYKLKIRTKGNDEEKYKWQLGHHFRNIWSSNDTIQEKVSKFNFANLLYYNAVAVLKHISKEHPEFVERSFTELFNANKPLQDRLDNFKNGYREIYSEMGHDNLSTHQDERSMATYLTFNDPKNYTYFKDSFYRKYCKVLGIKIEKPGKKYVHYLSLVSNFIDEYINDDKELLEIKATFLDETCDPDTNNLILAQDILYQTLDLSLASQPNYWRIGTTEGETNGESKWQKMVDGKYIAIGWPEIGNLEDQQELNKDVIIGLLKDEGYYPNDNRTASRKAGEILTFCESIKTKDVVVAQEGADVLGIGIVQDNYEHIDDDSFAHIRRVDWKVIGTNLTNQEGLRTTVYQLYDKDFISKVNALLSYPNITQPDNVQLKNQTTMDLNTILYGPPGTGKTFKLQEIINRNNLNGNNSQNKETAQGLDEFVAGFKWWEIAALALFDTPNKKATIPELKKHPFIVAKNAQSNFKDLGPRLWGTIQNHTVDTCPNVNIATKSGKPIFFKEEDSTWRFDDVDRFIKDYEILVEDLNQYKGTTPNLSGSKRYVFTTCHQSLNYEDFIEGIKPIMNNSVMDEEGELGYEIRKGYFYNACNEAAKLAGYTNLNECLEADKYDRELKFKDALNNGKVFYIFLDEINRCNVSAVFGELITLIEIDKRLGAKNEIADIILPYSQQKFGVPSNLYIVGTMNTADRSVEALDTALRRRFIFEEMMPDPSIIKIEPFSEISLRRLLEIMNQRIAYLLDEDHQIGHSYFLNVDTPEGLKKKFKNSIIPLLKEYFYNDYEKIQWILGKKFVTNKTSKTKFAKGVTVDFDKDSFEFVPIDDGFDIVDALKDTLNEEY